MKKLFLLLLAVTIGLCASAQMRTVHGTVVDANTQEELIGVSVKAGPQYGVATDASGQFTLRIPESVKTLTVSYVGYQTVDVPVENGDMRINLVPDNALLDPVIVVAYGEQKRSSFTGSAATVGAATIEKTQVTNPLDALAGKVAGLQLSNASGAPGASSPTIRIRGFSSILAGNAPLVIVDGAPYSGDINTINANDIESMSVLKDAASNALYGARGANGVILITTKRAKLGEAVVSVDAKWGANSKGSQNYDYITDPAQYYETYYAALYNQAHAPKDPKLTDANRNDPKYLGLGMSSYEAWKYANSQLALGANPGLGYITYTVPAGQTLIGQNGRMNPNATPGRMINYRGQDYWIQPDNWNDYAYKTSLRQEYNVNISHGTERSNIMASVNYLSNDGILIAKSNYQRFTGRLAADFQAKPWLKVGGNFAYAHGTTNQMTSEGSSTSTMNIFAFTNGVAPIYPLYLRDGNKQPMYDNNGLLMYDYGNGMNAGLQRPAYADSNAISAAILNTNKADFNTLYASGFAEIRFLRDFKFTTNNTVNLLESRSTSMMNPYYGQAVPDGGTISKAHSRTTSYTFNQLLNWNRVFNNSHTVQILLGHEWYKAISEELEGSRKNLFLPSNEELAGAILKDDTSSSSSVYNNEGWFGRAQYDYDSKYFGSFSFRRDASSRFHPKHRWGSFWSIGGAWIISKEDFFNVDWVDLLKIKASYGEQGNDNIGNYRYTDTYSLINSVGMPGAVAATKGNETITWEKGGNFNAGVEFELFNARLNGSFEAFYRKTSDMLMSFPLPASSGFMGYYDNVGDMTNTGIEIELSGTIIRTRDFAWTMDLNFTWYKNRISKLPEERKGPDAYDGHRGFSSGSTFYGEGLPMYTYLMKSYAGVEESTGRALYWKNTYAKDTNGNPTKEIIGREKAYYENADFYLCGTALAPVYGGFSTSFEYKGFDLSANFNYQIGGQVYDSGYQALMASPVSGGGSNFHADVLKAWTPENPSSNIPRFQFGDQDQAQTQDRFLTNASYLSLQNLNFGYTLPSNIVRKMYLTKLRVYFAAENVWVWSKRQGLDPRQSITGGTNNYTYSPIRTLSGGLTVTF